MQSTTKNGSSASSASGTPIMLPILLASQGSGVGAGGVSGGPSWRTDAANCRWISSGDCASSAAASRCNRSRSAACNAASSRICRTVRPTQFTYCVAGVTECACIQASRSSPRLKPSQCSKICVEPGAGECRQLRQHRLGRTVAVAEEHQPNRQIVDRHAILPEIIQRLVVQDHEARHMQPIEARERHQRIVRIDHAGSRIHRRQQRAQPGLLAGRDRRRHHEVRLRRHAARGAIRTAARNRSAAPCPSTPCPDRGRAARSAGSHRESSAPPSTSRSSRARCIPCHRASSAPCRPWR